MAGADADYQKVMKDDLPALNRSLAESAVAPLVVAHNLEPAKQQ
jgi:hypothetical protein